MQFTDLPEEILIIIIRKLDVKSQYGLYNTCKLLRNVVCMQGVLKYCSLSMNSMATANTLQLNFFKDISSNLVELNLCGVLNLCKTKFFPALRKLKRLRVLDISYTDMTMSELVGIHKLCPTIKDITINFVWKCKSFEVPKSVLVPYQRVLKHFENITFIGSFGSLVYSGLPFYLLQKARPHQLKFIAISSYFTGKCLEKVTYPEFDHFALYVIENSYDLNEHWPVSHILSMLLLKECEYIVMATYAYATKIYASPRFTDFFKDVFKIDVEITPLTEIDFSFIKFSYAWQSTGVLFMVWNKETTTFDDKFYSNLTKHIKENVPYVFEFQLEREVPAPKKYDLFYISPIPYYSKQDEVVVDSIKRKRVAAPNYVLNYDVLFKDEEKVKLIVHFKHSLYNGVALTNNCMYLRKLTYLSLIDLGKYTSDFFKILFSCCVNLLTLNVQSPSSAQCATAISRSLSLSKSLKNLRISENMVDFKLLFSSLSRCPSIENVHVTENLMCAATGERNDIGNPSSLVEVLDHLYSIYIEAPISQTAITKCVQLFNKAKKMYNKQHISFEINSMNTKEYRYYPYVAVFKSCPINVV